MHAWLKRFASLLTGQRSSAKAQLTHYPRLEPLEDRTLPASALLTALTTQRSWITYSPSTMVGDDYNCAPSEAHVTKDLQTLYQEGWRGLVTYNLLGAYGEIPRIAKSVGFQYVIAGLYHVSPTSPATCGFDNPHQAELDNATNADIAKYIDGFMVGNEGLADGRYTIEQLTTEISTIRNNPNTTGKPVTTSEKSDSYLNTSAFRDQLRTIGDWWFPNSNFYCWNNAPEDPAATWNNVGYAYNQLQLAAKPLGMTVVYHESWYPTGPADQPLATQENQVTYYQLMATGKSKWFKGKFYFVWGEAFNQSWKSGEACNQGPNWGLHGNNPAENTRKPNLIITKLQKVYTGTYGSETLAGAQPKTQVTERTRMVSGTAINERLTITQHNGVVAALLHSQGASSAATAATDHLFALGFEGDGASPARSLRKR
jgi:exo-beta-1,3-glucanase (GH17 family)